MVVDRHTGVVDHRLVQVVVVGRVEIPEAARGNGRQRKAARQRVVHFDRQSPLMHAHVLTRIEIDLVERRIRHRRGPDRRRSREELIHAVNRGAETVQHLRAIARIFGVVVGDHAHVEIAGRLEQQLAASAFAGAAVQLRTGVQVLDIAVVMRAVEQQAAGQRVGNRTGQ